MLWILMGALAISGPPKAVGWSVYSNVRYGFSVCYPPTLIPRPEAANGDGRVFYSRDGAILRVYGSNNINTSGVAAAMRDELDPGDRVTYSDLHKSWGVLSGRVGSRIFYNKTFARGDQLISMEFNYPATATPNYGKIVSQLEKCFRPGLAAF